MFLHKLNSLVSSLIDQHHTNVDQRAHLLITAAMLILAEEIHTLATSATTLAQATQDLVAASQGLVNEIGTATATLTDAISKLPVATTPDETAAVTAIEGVVTQLNQATAGVTQSATQIQSGLSNLEQIPAQTPPPDQNPPSA